MVQATTLPKRLAIAGLLWYSIVTGDIDWGGRKEYQHSKGHPERPGAMKKVKKSSYFNRSVEAIRWN
jgi:hypothetical protein